MFHSHAAWSSVLRHSSVIFSPIKFLQCHSYLEMTIYIRLFTEYSSYAIAMKGIGLITGFQANIHYWDIWGKSLLMV
jgi:hypothetical protein